MKRIVYLFVLATLEAMGTQVSAQSHVGIVVQSVQVINELGSGIESEIRIVDPSDRDEHFTYTDKKGVSEPKKPCSPASRLMPRPKIDIYRRLTRLPYCTPDVKIVLQRTGIAEQLAELGDMAVTSRDFTVASMLYTESAYRIAEFNPELADSLRSKAFSTFQQKYPGMELVKFDPSQEKVVLTSEGSVFLKQYQFKNKLHVTGQLDISTLQAMSGKTLYPFIREAYATPYTPRSDSPFRWEQTSPEGGFTGGPLTPQNIKRRKEDSSTPR